MTLTLYGFGESGPSYKIALTLRLCGLDYDLRFVDFFNGESRSPAYRALNVMGEVPVLVDGDLTLSQSGVIQQYLIEKTGQLGGATKADQWEVLRWISWDNHKLSAMIGMTRFLSNFVPDERRPKSVISFNIRRIHSAFKVLDEALKGRDYLVGDALSAADLACSCYLYYPEGFGFNQSDWPAIDAWLKRISATPGWAHPYDLMPRAFQA